MNTRKCKPVNLTLTKKLFPENSQGFFGNLDINKIRFSEVGDSINRTSFGGMIPKTDNFTSFDDVTYKLVEIHNINT